MQLAEKELESEQDNTPTNLEQKLVELQEKLQDTKHKYQETIGIVDELENKLRREQQQQRAHARRLTALNKKLNTLGKECTQRYVQIAMTRQRCPMEEETRDLVKEDKSEVTSIGLPSVSRMLEDHTMEKAEANSSSSTGFPLISQEANVHEGQEHHDPSPLHGAVVGGRKSMVFALLKASADANARACTLATPLICAAKGGNFEVSQLLIKFGANVNFRDSKNMTALHYACSRGSKSLARLLIKSGANLSVKANDKTPADTAESSGHKRLAKYIRSNML